MSDQEKQPVTELPPVYTFSGSAINKEQIIPKQPDPVRKDGPKK